MKKISDKQREVYDFLVKRMENGRPPSVREIGTAVGLRSPSSVQSILDALEEADYIKRDPMLKRSVRVANRPENIVQVPLFVNHVAAGSPDLIADDKQVECYIPYPGKVSSDKSLFALRIQGESMRDSDLLDGDIIFVEWTKDVNNRQKVVARIGEGATVKTFFREKGHIRLQPENQDFEPIICEEDEVEILGKVIGLIRYYQ
jgi:repressor LexA